MHMIGSHMPLHDLDIQRSANLSRQIPHLFPDLSSQSRLAVLGDEHKVISQPIHCMRTFPILRHLRSVPPSLLKASPKGEGVHPSQSGTLSLPARRSAPWRAAACLLLFALAAPAPGLAQTTALWTATLTVGTTTDTDGNTVYGYLTNPFLDDFGSLSPATFVRSTATVGVNILSYNSGTFGKLVFEITRAAGTIPSDGLLGSADLVLTLGSETFTFTPSSATRYELDRGDLDWNDGDTVAVSLAPPNNAPVITTTSPISVPENTTAVTTLAATDADTDTTLTWSKNGGVDADASSR